MEAPADGSARCFNAYYIYYAQSKIAIKEPFGSYIPVIWLEDDQCDR